MTLVNTQQYRHLDREFFNFTKTYPAKVFFNILVEIIKFLNWAKYFVFIINPMFRHRLGLDIHQLRFNNCEMLEGHDQLIQDHIDEFYKRIESLWDVKNEGETLKSFKNNIKFKNIPSFIKELYKITSWVEVPEINSEDRYVIQKLYNIYKDKDHDLREEISLRDIKIYHNVCVKCMNHAIQNGNKALIIALCDACEILEASMELDVLLPVHKERLSRHAGFIDLLQTLAHSMKYDIDTLDIENRDKLATINVLLIFKFLGKEALCKYKLTQRDKNGLSNINILYGDINNLILFADNVCREMRRHSSLSRLEWSVYILKVGKDLGLVNPFVLIEIQKSKDKNSDFSAKDLKDILLKYNTDFTEVQDCVAKFQYVVHDATKHIGIRLKKLFV